MKNIPIDRMSSVGIFYFFSSGLSICLINKVHVLSHSNPFYTQCLKINSLVFSIDNTPQVALLCLIHPQNAFCQTIQSFPLNETHSIKPSHLLL